MAGGGTTGSSMTDVLNEVRAQTKPYADEHRPLAGYAVLSGGFGVAFSSALAAAVSRRGELPERIRIGDIAMTGIATHKLTRLIAKDRVTSFLRAPFVTYQEPSGHGEVEEAPRRPGTAVGGGRAARMSLLPGPVGRRSFYGRVPRRAPVHAIDCRHVYGRGGFRLRQFAYSAAEKRGS